MTRKLNTSAFVVAALGALSAGSGAHAAGWAVGIQAGWQQSGQLTLAETGASSSNWTVLDNGACWGACFSPDASEVAYVENGAIKVISIHGTNARVVKSSGLYTSGTRANSLSWCTNGYIYYTPTAQQRSNTGYAQEDCDCLVSPQWQEAFEAKALEVLSEL